MEEKNLLKIALISSLFGVLLILFISEKTDLSMSNIANITNSSIDQKVKIKGYITSLAETPGLYILNVRDNTGEITTIIFKEEKINLSKNDLIEVEGKVSKYKDKIEIIADLIILIK